jgi:hypothetical protein
MIDDIDNVIDLNAILHPARFTTIPAMSRPSPILGTASWGDCTALVNAVEGRTIHEILGSPDDLKFCSSMTLFDAVSSDPKFATAISKFYGGKPDPRTLDLLAASRQMDRR